MRAGASPEQWKVVPLAPKPVSVFVSPDPKKVSLDFPYAHVLPHGRFLITMDLSGPGTNSLSGPKGALVNTHNWVQGKLFVSTDKGLTWLHKHDYPFCNAVLIRDANNLYLLGHRGNIMIMKSPDGGETWSKPVDLTFKDDMIYTQSPVNVLHANGNIYVVLMRAIHPEPGKNRTSDLTPVVMRAAEGASLTNKGAWTFSEPGPTIDKLAPFNSLNHFGFPFFYIPDLNRGKDIGQRRWAHRPGWCFPHPVSIQSPLHCWHDGGGKTIHILFAADVHRSGVAVLVRLVEDEAGRMKWETQKTPAQTSQVFLPLPGGNSKFHILYDAESALYWLLSNQNRDSMIRVEKLGRERIGLPCNEQARLELSFSSNLVDWCFAGYVCGQDAPGELCLQPVMDIRGGDLYLAYVVRNTNYLSEPQPDKVVAAVIPDFRGLVY